MKALGLHNKVIREERFERWETYKEQLVGKSYIVTEVDEGTKVTISGIILNNYGVIDFYPKANRILIRKSNKWISQGLKWIINNLLKP